MWCPKGIKGRTKACRLLRALYGLKQAPRAWYLNILESLKEEGEGAAGLPGCIFYPTCLMFKRGGEQEALFLSLLVEKKVGQNDKLPISLL